jgi:histidine triad (HIT) family protein
MADCIFCSIIEGRAPASFLYQDDRSVAFLDLFPILAGHALVVPRAHVADLTACPADVAGHLMTVAQQLAPKIVRSVNAAGFNVWTANGAVAGQDVFHLHLHVLPRFDDDAFRLRFPQPYPQQAERDKLDALADRIKKSE